MFCLNKKFHKEWNQTVEYYHTMKYHGVALIFQKKFDKNMGMHPFPPQKIPLLIGSVNYRYR